MSRIYFHGLSRTSEVLGAERAYMDIVCLDFAASMINSATYFSKRHPLFGLVPPDRLGDRDSLDIGLQEKRLGSLRAANSAVTDNAAMYLRGYRGQELVIHEERHNVRNLVLNTMVAARSPVMALMAKIHGYCESHLWVPEEHREWLADVIADGRLTNLLRPNQGWELVIDHLISGDGGPVVMSYSVSESFPHDSTWMDAAWPEEMVASGKYEYNVLTDEQKQAVDARDEEWCELPEDEQWRLGMADIERKPWLKLTPDTLTVPTFNGTTSLWDAIMAPEWSYKEED